ATVRRSAGGGRAGCDVLGLRRCGTRRIAGGGQSHVAVRTAPLIARRGDRTLGVHRDHFTAGIPTHGAGPAAHAGAGGLHRFLQRARRGRRGTRARRARRRGRRSHRARAAARTGCHFRDPRTCRSRKPLGGNGYGVVEAGSDVVAAAAAVAVLLRRRHLRWLVSHKGYLPLRRQVQIATMKRSDSTTSPPGISIRTGPDTSTGPLGTTCTLVVVIASPRGSRSAPPRAARAGSGRPPPATLPGKTSPDRTVSISRQSLSHPCRPTSANPATAGHRRARNAPAAG